MSCANVLSGKPLIDRQVYEADGVQRISGLPLNAHFPGSAVMAGTDRKNSVQAAAQGKICAVQWRTTLKCALYAKKLAITTMIVSGLHAATGCTNNAPLKVPWCSIVRVSSPRVESTCVSLAFRRVYFYPIII